MAIIFEKYVWILWRRELDSACFAYCEEDDIDIDYLICCRKKRDIVAYQKKHDLHDYEPKKISHKEIISLKKIYSMS